MSDSSPSGATSAAATQIRIPEKIAEPGKRATVLWLAAILLLATSLCFVGLGAGLRHTPPIDERYFVEATAQMIARGDFDHRLYGYPGFFFYVLYPALKLAPYAHYQPDVLGVPAQAAPAYLAARGVTAFFGVVQVLLVFWLGVRVASRLAGLVAAALIAVSPVSVFTAHSVRPDTLLAALALLALIAFQRLGLERRRDAVAGVLVGLACAAKFTGFFLAPVYFAARLLAPGPRLRGTLTAAAAAIVTFAALSPYALLHSAAFRAGASDQVGHHYASATSWIPTYFPMLVFYAQTWPGALGLAAGLMALAGLALTWQRFRVWLPLWIFPLVTVIVMATSYRRLARHLLPSLPVIALLAGVAVSELAKRWPRAGLLTALALPLGPLGASAAMVVALAQPGSRDLALDWIDANVAPGARVVTTVPELGLARERFEVLAAESFGGSEGMLAREADLVVTTPADLRDNVAPFPLIARFMPRHPVAGPAVEIRSVPDTLRRTYRELASSELAFAASDSPELLALLHDGQLETAWETRRAQVPRMWVEIRLARPQLVGALELDLGPKAGGWGRRLGVFTKNAAGRWEPVRASSARAAVSAQLAGRTATQRLVFPPTLTSALRIVQARSAPRPWRIAELHVLALAKPAAAPRDAH